MNGEKRYVLTFEKYIWAKDDNDAKEQANQFAVDEQLKNDDQCQVQGIVEQPFGTFGNREVYRRGV